MIEYKQNTVLPEEYLKRKINDFLAEDSTSDDKTTIGTVPEGKEIKGYLEAQADMVFAGKPIIEYIFKDLPKLEILVSDGEKLKSGQIIARFAGNARIILSCERVLLNLLQRLSGIATQTAVFAEKTKASNIKILDTRKTTPGLRLFEKYAVTCGGGFNHRFCLASGILIKDNHITAAGSIANALSQIKAMNLELPIEIEVDLLSQISEAMEIGVDGFLLDNMNREQTLEAVKLIRSYPNGDDIFIESSGGINLSNIDNYFETGINAISIGALTHSVKAADIHLEFEF